MNPVLTPFTLHFLGELELAEGSLERAAELLVESMQLYASEGRRDLAKFARHGLADVRLEQGEFDEAARLYRESNRISISFSRSERPRSTSSPRSRRSDQ